VDARYVGQNFELAVPAASGAGLSPGDLPNLAQLHASFISAHETAYGYASEDDPVEIVNVRLTASARLYREAGKQAEGDEHSEPQPVAQRLVYFDADAAVEAQVYARSDLRAGHCINGPAIIEQLDTTTPVYPGDVAQVTAEGHLIIKIQASAGDPS